MGALELQKSFRNQVEKNFKDSYARNEIFLTKPNHSSDSDWVEIPDNVFIYSAYLDSCHSLFVSSYCVKFVGAILDSFVKLNADISSIMCAFKYSSNAVVKHGFAYVKKVPESHGKHFTAALFFCSLFGNDKENNWPQYASLYQYASKNITWLPVHIHVPVKNIPLSISLCVRPLFDFVSVVALGEFLAFYSVLGVDHFIFYEQKPVDTVSSFLNVINLANISVEILPWNISIAENEIHEYGQIVFSQDCIARCRHVFSHTLIVDIDEFLVPRKHGDLKLLASHLDKTNPKAGSYIVRMSLFCDEYPIETVKDPPLKILMQDKRQKSVWEARFRSKYIARPERTQMVGIHQIWAHENGMKEVVVSDSVALLHHYKPCCYGTQTWFFRLLSYPILRDKVIEDNSLLRFEKLIVSHPVIQLLLSPDSFLPQNRTEGFKQTSQ